MDAIFNREYIVDLVCEPGNVRSPDSSVNGGLLAALSSPFQISRLQEFQQTFVYNSSCNQIPMTKQTYASSGLLSPGMVLLNLFHDFVWRIEFVKKANEMLSAYTLVIDIIITPTAY